MSGGNQVKITDAYNRPISSSNPLPVTSSIDDNGGSITVDGTFWQATQPISGTVTASQATAASLNAQVVGNVASASADSGNPLKIGGRYSATQPTLSDGQRGNIQISNRGELLVKAGVQGLGGVNHDAVDSGAPVKVGGKAATSIPTAVANGDRVNAYFDANGRQVILQAAQLVPKIYDYISLSYTGDNLTGVVYKSGGGGGSTVATLTLSYTGSVLDTITRT